MKSNRPVHLEIEAKFRVDSHEPIRERLIASGAQPLGTVLETNEILDASDGSLRHRGCGVRVRATIDEKTGEQIATMTFKGPVRAGPFKSREEQEIEVSDADTAVRILSGLGLVRMLWYQKRRESWHLDDCRVELDEPPHVGLFVEIEGSGDAAISTVAKNLGLGGAVHEKTSYARMLLEYCAQHAISDRAVPLGSATSAP